jgi:hypothetical protein
VHYCLLMVATQLDGRKHGMEVSRKMKIEQSSRFHILRKYYSYSTIRAFAFRLATVVTVNFVVAMITNIFMFYCVKALLTS